MFFLWIHKLISHENFPTGMNEDYYCLLFSYVRIDYLFIWFCCYPIDNFECSGIPCFPLASPPFFSIYSLADYLYSFLSESCWFQISSEMSENLIFYFYSHQSCISCHSSLTNLSFFKAVACHRLCCSSFLQDCEQNAWKINCYLRHSVRERNWKKKVTKIQ